MTIRGTIPVLALLLMMPAAGATWYAPGSQEPDTAFDRVDGRMFTQPDEDGTDRRVYFNAWQAVEGTSSSPNVARLGTTVVHPEVRHRALLGVWKDCNHDGYVGHAESAVQEYHAALADTTVCPPGSLHNDGLWVAEMLNVGKVDPCELEPDAAVRVRECPTYNPVEPTVPAFAANEHVLYSLDTYVWGDLGAPGSTPAAECVLTPAPRGTTSGTGPLLRWADCQTGYEVNATLALAGQPAPDLAFPLSLFGTPTGGTGLLQQGSDDPAFTAWDCASRDRVVLPAGAREIALQDRSGGRMTGPVFPFVVTGHTFNDEDGDASTGGWMRIRLDADGAGTLLFLPRPDPTLRDPTGSWWDAGEASADALRGDCDPDTRSELQARHPGTLVEDGDRLVPDAQKDRATLTFTFYDGHRGFHKDVDPFTGATTPSDGGLILLRHGRGGAGPLWSSIETTTQDPQVLQRGDVAPARAVYWTYYARVGPDAVSAYSLELPILSSAAYGSDNCGTSRSGVLKGWVCDPALWWKDAAGNDVRPRYARGEPLGRLIGDPYDLRDVDCYDGSLARGTGVYASLVLLAENGACVP